MGYVWCSLSACVWSCFWSEAVQTKEVYLVIQLVVWPWKTPLINLADGALSMLLLLLLSVASAFLEALEGEVRATYSVLAGIILFSLYGISFVLLCMVVAAFFHKAAMGSASELVVLTLGTAPQTADLVKGLEARAKSKLETTDLGTGEAKNQ